MRANGVGFVRIRAGNATQIMQLCSCHGNKLVNSKAALGERYLLLKLRCCCLGCLLCSQGKHNVSTLASLNFASLIGILKSNPPYRLVAASLLATCRTTLPLLMFLKTDMASECDIPWSASPFTARTSSPAA